MWIFFPVHTGSKCHLAPPPHIRQRCKAWLSDSKLLWFSSQIPVGSSILRIPGRQVFSQTKMIWWLSSEVLCKPAPPSPAFPPPSPWNRESRETDGSLNTENSPSWQTPPQQFPPQPHASFAKCDVTTGRVPCLNQSNDLASLDFSVLFFNPSCEYLSFHWASIQ